ncbi:MAG: triple tyrosine motif-containing protein [Saprospiraceae bacterium]
MEIVGLIRFFPLIVLLSIPKSAYSQSPALKVIDNKIDLYSRGPISLLRDSKGFLWIGTKFDLVKFDGQSKEYFTHDSENPNSILGRAVMDIFEDKDRVIWISFVNGVSRYNPTTNSFENFTKENGGIDTDFTEAHFFNVGYDLYASGIHRGLFKFDKKKRLFKNVVNEGVTGTNFSASADTDGNIYLYGPKGLFNYNPISKDIKLIDTLPRGLLSDPRTIGINLVTKKNIWFGTWGDGLLQYNFNKKKFIKSIWDHKTKLNSYTNIVLDVIEIPNLMGGQDIYVATTHGVFKFAEVDNTNIENSPLIFNQTARYLIHDNNSLWICSEENGIYKIDLYPPPFQLVYKSPTGLLNYNRQKNGNLFIADADPALVILDSNYSIKKTFRYLPNHIKNENSLLSWISVYNPFDNQIYVGTFNGLSSVDPNGSNYRWYPPKDSLGLIGRKVIRIYPLDSSKMIIGYWKNSVQILNYKTGKNFKILIPGKPILWNIKAEGDSILYLCLNNAIYIYHPYSDELNIMDVKIADQDFYDIQHIKERKYLIGTSEGLYIYDIDSCKVTSKFGILGGNCFNSVDAIVPLSYPSFLLLTNAGLVQFNIQTEECKILSDYWPELGGGHRLKQQKNGEILAGIGDNLYRILPDKLIRNNVIHPYIKSIVTNKREIFLFSDSYTQEKIKFSPDEKQFQFNFSPLDESLSKNIQLEYQLSGISENWIRIGNQRSISFYNLPYGTYRFSTRATGQDPGMVKIASVNFEITEHFWNKKWFMIIMIISILGSVFQMIYKVRKKNILIKNIALTNQLNTQRAINDERNRMAKDLHDDLGSQVSALRLMVELTKLNATNQATRNEIGKFAEMCSDLANKIREVIWVTHDRNANWESVVDFLSQYARTLLESLNIDLLENRPEAFPSEIVMNEKKKNIYLAFKEIINNVIKHSRATQCNIVYEFSKDEFILTIRDNGIGFLIDEKNKLHSDGSGNGLNNIQDRIKSLNGFVRIDSNLGKGSEISITIPIVEE